MLSGWRKIDNGWVLLFARSIHTHALHLTWVSVVSVELLRRLFYWIKTYQQTAFVFICKTMHWSNLPLIATLKTCPYGRIISRVQWDISDTFLLTLLLSRRHKKNALFIFSPIWLSNRHVFMSVKHESTGQFYPLLFASEWYSHGMSNHVKATLLLNVV